MPGSGGQDRSAEFETFYTARYAEIAGYVRRRVADHDCDDVIAQVFTIAWRRFDSVPPPPQDRLWLFGVARNSVAEHERSLTRRQRLRGRLADASAIGPLAPQSDPRYEPVLSAMSALRHADREALQLVLWDGLTHAEAATLLGCSVNAFELRYRRARTAVRDAVLASQGHSGPGRIPSLRTANSARENMS
jgi:RNA polymerase sigma factor (sigma-70 family)